MQDQFEVDRQQFLRLGPVVKDAVEPVAELVIEPDKPTPPLDAVSEDQDKAVDLLAEFRRRPREKKEDTVEESLLKEFRHDPDDDLLSQFRRQTDEQTRKRSRGLGL